jgi:hypothetical protein
VVVAGEVPALALAWVVVCTPPHEEQVKAIRNARITASQTAGALFRRLFSTALSHATIRVHQQVLPPRYKDRAR